MLQCNVCYEETMIKCNICERSYCPWHYLKHACKIICKSKTTSVPFFTGNRTDPFPFTPNSEYSKLPLCCAPGCTLIAMYQCDNISTKNQNQNQNLSQDPDQKQDQDQCRMFFCALHSAHVHHMCDHEGCNNFAEKCIDQPFGCDIICCARHWCAD